MKKVKWWTWLLLIAATAGLACSLLAVDAVGSHLQYIVEPSGDAAEAAAELTGLAEEWASTQRAWTLGGFIQEATLKAETQSARGRVTLYGQNGLTLQPQTLLYGRLFTEDELQSGAPLALLDEQMAFALFREADVTGRSFNLGGQPFQVIGVVCHARQVGDATDCGAYIPLLCGIQPDALIVEADPLPGVGAGVSFSGVCELWRSGGTFIDLHKEAVGATMWARALGFVIGTVALIKGIRWLNAGVRRAMTWHQRALQHKYATQLLPQSIGPVVLLVAEYALAAGCAALLLGFIIEPVYIFPECVPAVLVEWEDIQSTFWQVQQSAANFRELRTPELLRIRYFQTLINISSAVMAVVLAHAIRVSMNIRTRRIG